MGFIGRDLFYLYIPCTFFSSIVLPQIGPAMRSYLYGWAFVIPTITVSERQGGISLYITALMVYLTNTF